VSRLALVVRSIVRGVVWMAIALVVPAACWLGSLGGAL
jgi:hypothetical protein